MLLHVQTTLQHYNQYMVNGFLLLLSFIWKICLLSLNTSPGEPGKLGNVLDLSKITCPDHGNGMWDCFVASLLHCLKLTFTVGLILEKSRKIWENMGKLRESMSKIPV